MRPLAKTTKSTSVNTRSCSQNASTLSMIAINRDVNDQPVHPSGSWIGPGKLDVSFAPLATLSLHPAIDDRTELSGRIKLNCPSATLPISTISSRDSDRLIPVSLAQKSKQPATQKEDSKQKSRHRDGSRGRKQRCLGEYGAIATGPD